MNYLGTTSRQFGVGLALLGLALGTPACGDSDDDGQDDVADEGDSDEGSDCVATPQATFPEVNESACVPSATDYVPGTDDPYDACATDDGKYHLVEGTPSSVARVEAYDEIVALLAGRPSPDDFVTARTVYALDEGLESRLLRREDLHHPAIPESDFDSDFEDDKQCSSPLNVEKHADRCAGPAKIAPLINEAFLAGVEGTGAPEVHAARIEAAGLWFIALSVYKEANTCITKAKDCDSSWAYYSGGFDRAGGIGLAAEARALSELAHNRVFDGVSAVRCWRELYPIETYPLRSDLDETGERLLSDALEQLDNAIWYSLARIVRDRLENQDAVCGEEAEANWAFIEILDPVLDLEASARGATEAASLLALWANPEPSASDLEAGVAANDAVFPCP
ncbi:MAG: hypothetical protein JKY37_22635 [Nannocystaceae bacterium]|nr:hypothetical protein [Nannocystaceae bacterium]